MNTNIIPFAGSAKRSPVPVRAAPIVQPALLPAMAAHAELCAWICANETLCASAWLVHASRTVGAQRALFISRDDDGVHRLRLCEGCDERWMRWVDQRRAPAQLGPDYAQRLAAAWLARLRADGWRLVWHSARARGPVAVATA